MDDPAPAPDASRLEQRAAAVVAQFPEIAGAYLFGSWARGEARPESDVDIGLILHDAAAKAVDHYWMLADLASRLEVLFGGRAVDVVLLEPQGPIFCHRVLTEGRRIFTGNRDRCIDFESTTYVRYFDFRPTYEIAARERIRGMRRWLRKGAAS